MSDRTSTDTALARQIAGQRTVDIDRLDATARRALGDALYPVQQLIFHGPEKEEFLDHVMFPDAERNMVRLYLDEAGATVGFCAVHRYRRKLNGRTYLVLRAEAGLHPDFRGRGSTYWFGITRALRQKLRHPFTPLYYLGTLVHVSSYHLFYKYFPKIYPTPDRDMPDRVRDLALDLSESFHFPAVDPSDPLVRDAGWTTIETPQEAVLSHQDNRLDVAYYRKRNPGYAHGHGLVVLVPLSWPNLAGAVFRRLREVISHKVTGRRPHL
ncbi:hypothetical protein RXV86_14825 [Alisedimentitalea sp. MJ-SS2]|uniref:hypothetical protein n=1 Tax=Aliisedimentitalea sp. MJ-SS2 TaxID=3049795 RepID=UPI00290A31E2|nr:hypothetical protein [Alisedimentitalea sp. MJ-SS2]MDU8928663.1 hypothetical protein [Alisedimentitalea sp. MJ-SS2]